MLFLEVSSSTECYLSRTDQLRKLSTSRCRFSLLVNRIKKLKLRWMDLLDRDFRWFKFYLMKLDHTPSRKKRPESYWPHSCFARRSWHRWEVVRALNWRDKTRATFCNERNTHRLAWNTQWQACVCWVPMMTRVEKRCLFECKERRDLCGEWKCSSLHRVDRASLWRDHSSSRLCRCKPNWILDVSWNRSGIYRNEPLFIV